MHPDGQIAGNIDFVRRFQNQIREMVDRIIPFKIGTAQLVVSRIVKEQTSEIESGIIVSNPSFSDIFFIIWEKNEEWIKALQKRGDKKFLTMRPNSPAKFTSLH